MKTIRLPYYILIGFNILTLIVYLSNPFYNSLTQTHNTTLIYLLFNIACLIMGYKAGLKKANKLSINNVIRTSQVTGRFISFYFVFYILTFMLKYAYELRCPAFSLSALFNRIMVGIANPLVGYEMTINGAQSFSWSIYVLINGIDCLFFIIGMLFWKSLNKWQKTLFVLLAIFDILKWFGAGTSFGIMVMCTTFVMAVSSSIQKDYLSKKNVSRLFLALIFVFLLAVLAFGLNMEGRAGGEFSNITIENYKFNEDSFVYKYLVSYLPMRFQNMYVYVSHYLVGGYYNLEYIFNCNYDWCYMLGRNNTLTTIADDILGLNIESLNYQTKLYALFGVHPYIEWHSCYLWLANDYTKFGVPVVIYFIGKFTSAALFIFRKHHDIVSGIIFMLLANMIIYLFANNNYLSGHYYAFIILFPYWFFTRYKRVLV